MDSPLLAPSTLLILTFLFSWNNGSLYLGGLTASGITRFRRAAFLISASMILGVIAEGWKMRPETLAGGEVFLPALLTAFLIFFFSNLLDIPVSLSNISVAALVGSSIALKLNLNVGFLLATVLAWIASPLASMALTWMIYGAMKRLLSSAGLITLDIWNRLAAYAITLYSAYTLSANNIGFVAGMTASGSPLTLIALSTSIIAGTTLFSKRISYMIGERLAVLSPQKLFSSIFSSSIILWVLTQLGVPGALTQTLIGGFIGAITSSPIAILNTRLIRKLIMAWVATTLMSVPTAYVITFILAL